MYTFMKVGLHTLSVIFFVLLTCVTPFPSPARSTGTNIWSHTFSSIHAHRFTDASRLKEEKKDTSNSKYSVSPVVRKCFSGVLLFWHLFPVYPPRQAHTLFLIQWPPFLQGGWQTAKRTHDSNVWTVHIQLLYIAHCLLDLLSMGP